MTGARLAAAAAACDAAGMDPWEHEDAETAIDEACARLGRPRRWVADDGYEHEIVGGAVDGARVAWVERRCQDDGGYEDVDYFLRVADGGDLARAWTVDTYNPYFGCDVHELSFWTDRVVVIYTEKHCTIAAALALSGGVTMQEIASRWRISGEHLLWESGAARGLIERARLPDLARCVPLPRGLVDAQLEAGAPLPGPEPEPLGDPAALQAAIARRLFGPRPPTPLAGLLIGALAWRFWDEGHARGATYEDIFHTNDWNDPHWLPFHWHHVLGGGERRALVAALEEVAARPPADPDAGGWRVELACRHIAERCGVLVSACRKGQLPEGERCYFWVDWSQEGLAAADPARFPADLWDVWRSLRPHAARLRALGER